MLAKMQNEHNLCNKKSQRKLMIFIGYSCVSCQFINRSLHCNTSTAVNSCNWLFIHHLDAPTARHATAPAFPHNTRCIKLIQLTPFDRDGLAARSFCVVTWPLLAPCANPVLAMVASSYLISCVVWEIVALVQFYVGIYVGKLVKR